MTMQDLSLTAALVLAVLVLAALVAVLVTTRRARARQAEELAAARADASALRERVDALARAVESNAEAATPELRGAEEYVITDIGREPEASGEPTRIEGRLFADIVLRESLVKAGALTHGVRRALAPETRNRIRFEMKREVKRSRKQRRAEIRDLRREHAARARADEDLAG